MTHDELAADLAKAIGTIVNGMVWTDMQMGPSGSPRPDVWVMPLTYTKFTPISYEVKVSVADFRADITKAKWQSYLPFSSGVTFACEAGLLKPDDIPQGCGHIERLANGSWRHRKRPTLRRLENLPIQVWQKLVIDGVDRVHRQAALKRFEQWEQSKTLRARLGERVAKILKDQEAAELEATWRLDSARRQAQALELELETRRTRFQEELKRDVDGGLIELARALGISDFTPDRLWPLTSAIRTARHQLVESRVLQSVAATLDSLDAQLKRAREVVDRSRNPTADNDVEIDS